MVSPIEAYIRQRAPLFGVDPDIAVRVAKSEGGLSNPTQQSTYVKNGRRERSYGPFQLYIDGGLGNRALAAGIDPRKESDWQKGVDFALNEAGKKGWGQWYGAAKVGVGNWDGVRGGKGNDSLIGSASSPLSDPSIAEFVTNNPQPGGYGAEVENAVFGGGTGNDTMAGGTDGYARNASPFSIPQDVADYASGGQQGPLGKIGSFLEKLGAASPDAPQARGGGIGDARASGNDLAKVMAGPTIADMLLQRRMRGLLG